VACPNLCAFVMPGVPKTKGLWLQASILKLPEC